MQKSVIMQEISLNMNVDKNNCQPEIKKFNGKAAVTTSVSEPVRISAFACVLKQAAVAN